MALSPFFLQARKSSKFTSLFLRLSGQCSWDTQIWTVWESIWLTDTPLPRPLLAYSRLPRGHQTPSGCRTLRSENWTFLSFSHVIEKPSSNFRKDVSSEPSKQQGSWHEVAAVRAKTSGRAEANVPPFFLRLPFSSPLTLSLLGTRHRA